MEEMIRPVAVSSTMVKSSGRKVGCGRGKQVTRPGGEALSILFIIAVDLHVELCQRVRIFGRGTAHDQAIAQVTQNTFLIG